jgi:hypothetical protein
MQKDDENHEMFINAFHVIDSRAIRVAFGG